MRTETVNTVRAREIFASPPLPRRVINNIFETRTTVSSNGDNSDRSANFGSVKISLADPKRIREESYGEVKKPETVNYRSYKSERDGLFCEKIFGPEKDWECSCGKYKGMKYKGMVCDRCGVKITHSRERRKRMGHIELAAPVVHIWFFRAAQSRLAILLGMKPSQLDKVVYFQEYVVIDPKDSALSKAQVLTEDEYRQAVVENGRDSFVAGMGAEAIRELLKQIDLVQLTAELHDKVAKCNSAATKKSLITRLKLVEMLRNCREENKPEWMILDVIPVIPPDLRPLVQLDSGTFATSDLNDLYRRIINRNNRLAKLNSLNAPDVIIRNEKRMLQQSVDALFDNGRCRRKVQGSNGRALKSLTDMIKGKQGRFRENLLGKRVDYSARSVIVVGPHLHLHQCGLPKPIALELYQPFIIRQLKEQHRADTIKSAKKMLERRDPEVWDILEEVVKNHPVLLNRAPTLHRMGIQAFEPLLVEGKAIKLHPFVCKGFNADFDGDQMAVHLPLSLEAQVEAYTLMLSTNNIFSPASGDPIMMPQQDVVMGCYYITLDQPGMEGEGMIFSSFDECLLAYSLGKVHLQARVKVRMQEGRYLKTDESIGAGRLFETTPGRIIFNQILDEGPFYNYPLGSKELAAVISDCYERNGRKITIALLDKMMRLGFEQSTKSGLSFAADDLLTPPEKKELLAQGDAAVKQLTEDCNIGNISEIDRYNKTVDVWTNTNAEIANRMMESFKNDTYKENPDPNATKIRPKGYVNPVYLMATSGARGNVGQIRQLAGMRGLMARPNGAIIDTPVKANFLEGLTVFEYFTTTHAARKGLSDTALKTADSGYLTRKLADVAQNCVVTMRDCGATKGVIKRVLKNGDKTIPLSQSIVGRYPCEPILDPITEETIVTPDEMIDLKTARRIDELGVEVLQVRSPMTCEAKLGVCAKCYGMDLSTSRLVEEGMAVGIIAAQSIGEPGTQLTMRTFHSGGAATAGTSNAEIRTNYAGIVRFKGMQIVKDVYYNNALVTLVLGSNPGDGVEICNARGQARELYKMPNGAILTVKEGEQVYEDDVIAKYDPLNKLIVAMTEGRVEFHDVDEQTVKEVEDLATGRKNRTVADLRGDRHPRIDLLSPTSSKVTETYQLPSGSTLIVEDGAFVKKGAVLARVPMSGAGNQDITSGLPRVAEIFEARPPKDPAIVCEKAGVVHISEERKRGKQEVVVYQRGEDPKAGTSYVIPANKRLMVYEGNEVEAGQALTDGSINPKDVLRILGPEAVQDYLISEVQKVYRSQSVPINDKHIEIIISQMLRKYRVDDGGDTSLLAGETVDKFEYLERNKALDGCVKVKFPGDTDFTVGEIVTKEVFKSRNETFTANDPTATPATCEKCKKARGSLLLLGIAKAAIMSDSFLSAASFQETTKVLTEAALACKTDKLIGLKENVIVGRLIPAGTGFHLYQKAKWRSPHGHESGPLNGITQADIAAAEYGRDIDGGQRFGAIGDVALSASDEELKRAMFRPTDGDAFTTVEDALNNPEPKDSFEATFSSTDDSFEQYDEGDAPEMLEDNPDDQF